MADTPRPPPGTREIDLYVLHRVISDVPCAITLVAKTGFLTESPPGHVTVRRDSVNDVPFDSFAEGELLGEGTWTGVALTERTGSLSARGFDDVELALRAHLEASLRAALGTPPDETPN